MRWRDPSTWRGFTLDNWINVCNQQEVCEAFGIPWLDIRALSDLAGRDSRFDFMAFVDEVAASSAGILRQILPVL